MSSRGIAAVGIVCACLLPLTGCGKKVVSKSTVEQQVAAELAKEVNQPTPTVTCPDDLEAKVGATMTCTLTAQGDTSTTYPVTVTVSDVTDGVAHFHAEVGDANPSPSPSPS